MNKLKITTGEWWPCCADTTPYFVFAGEDSTVCAMYSNEGEDARYEPLEGIVTMEERRGHAKLITDAGNTYQKCGLLPSELLEQRDELLQTLKQIERGVTGLSLQALQTIASIEKQENETK